tara:strand:+ start:529 stop:924 length:396 start_codon:yes stop_codon:yes gene_type:complete
MTKGVMAMTPEGKVKDACKKELKKRGIWFYMPVQNGMGVVGIPDIIGCWNGWFIAIETKAKGKKAGVTTNQAQRLKEIHAAKGLALVIDDVEELVIILDDAVRQLSEVKADGSRDKVAEKPKEKSRIILPR